MRSGQAIIGGILSCRAGNSNQIPITQIKLNRMSAWLQNSAGFNVIWQNRASKETRMSTAVSRVWVDKTKAASKPADMSWPDFLTLLLHIGAEIEHGLMAEYLYAAYSLGGKQIPVGQRETVLRWRDNML